MKGGVQQRRRQLADKMGMSSRSRSPQSRLCLLLYAAAFTTPTSPRQSLIVISCLQLSITNPVQRSFQRASQPTMSGRIQTVRAHITLLLCFGAF